MDMARRGRADAVAKAKGRFQPKRGRVEPRQARPQRSGILQGQRTDGDLAGGHTVLRKPGGITLDAEAALTGVAEMRQKISGAPLRHYGVRLDTPGRKIDLIHVSPL